MKKIRFIKTTPHEDVDFIKQIKELRLKGSTISEKWYWYNYPRENSIMFNTRKAKEKTDHGKPPWKKMSYYTNLTGKDITTMRAGGLIKKVYKPQSQLEFIELLKRIR